MGAALLALLCIAPSPSADLNVVGPPVWLAGGRLAFPADDGVERLWWLTADGGPQPLRTEPAYRSVFQCWWSPAGDAMAYLADVAERRMVLVHDLDAGRAQPFSVVWEIDPPRVAWSPDGSRLAFSRMTDPGAEQPYEVFVLGSDGSGPMARIQMTAPPTALVWSPDGQSLAYVSRAGGREVLFTCRLEDKVAVACAPYLAVLPGSVSWSPNGAWLLFAGAADLKSGARLYAVQPAGQRAERVMVLGYFPEAPAAWSRDGRWLAWVAGTFSRPERGPVYLAPNDQPTAATALIRGVTWCVDPTFSPDCRWLAFTRYGDDPVTDSQVVCLRPGAPTERVVLERLSRWPVFSPDGRLAYVAGPPKSRRLRLADLPQTGSDAGPPGASSSTR